MMDLSYFYDVSAPYVQILGVSHLLYLMFCFIVLFYSISHSYLLVKYKNKIRKFILCLLLFQQVFLLYGWYYFMTGFDLSVSLPLHICRIASILTIVFLINEDKRLLDIIFYFSIYALISFFYPLNVYHFLHINGISYMINHLITVFIPVFSILVYGYRPSMEGLKKGLTAFTIYFIVIFIINPLVDGNYFYLTDRPFLHSLSYVSYGLLAYITTVVGFTLITKIIKYIQSVVCKIQTKLVTY